MKHYYIEVFCDPYNSKTHYHGEDVIKYNGITPVEWKFQDEEYDTLEDALDRLADIAREIEDARYEDVASIEEWKKMKFEDEGEEVECEWFNGDGFYSYDNNEPVYLIGERTLNSDVLFYRIEEIEVAEPKETKDITTLDEFAELINNDDEWRSKEYEDIIVANGWNDDTASKWGICSTDTESLEFNEEGIAVVILK